MRVIRRLVQFPLCVVGLHMTPPRRYPHGPIVADCPCCGRTCYFYGLSAYGIGGPPVLLPFQPVANLPSNTRPRLGTTSGS